MKAWFSAAELAGLPGLPGTVQMVNARAKREGWTWQKRAGRGGGREYAYASLPQRTRDHLLRRSVAALPPPTQPPVTVEPPRVEELADWQRSVMQARLGVCALIDQLTARHEVTRQAAIASLLDAARAGTLEAEALDMLRRANARAGGSSDRLADRATVYRWLQARDAQGAAAVAPKAAPATPPPAWLAPLLRLYQQPQKPTVAACLRDWHTHYPETPAPPLRTAQTRIQRLPVEIRSYGRMGRNALRAVQPFVRRTTDGLWPMDVVTVDGHLFKAYVRHPLTGRKLRPELTTYVDIATRRAVGFSAWLAESQLAIWAALRDMVLNPECGIPALHYSDNGAYRGAQHREVMARIGSETMFAQAYRAQARGVIERLNSSVWVPLAKTHATYVNDDADPEAVKKALKRANDDGANLMGWAEFIDQARAALEAYNDRPHSSFGKRTPNEAWAQAVAEGWRPTRLDDDDLHDLLPTWTRKVNRAEITLPWGRYFHDSLRDWHGRMVQIGIHPTDGGQVWVSDARGVLICVARLGANEQPYVHGNLLEHSRGKREAGRIGRLEKKLALVREEGAAQIGLRPADVTGSRIDDGVARGELVDTDTGAVFDDVDAYESWFATAVRMGMNQLREDSLDGPAFDPARDVG